MPVVDPNESMKTKEQEMKYHNSTSEYNNETTQYVLSIYLKMQ